MSLAWDEPGWLDRATDWIDASVERTGPVELMLARPWSAVARVPTATGDAWFKEDPPALEFEPALTAALARVRPENVPDVIAADGPRLLTRDAGRRLRNLHNEGVPEPGWEELLVRFAELQIDLMAATVEALSVGTPDRCPTRLPGLAAGLPGWDDAVEPIRRAADGLGGTIPLTVVHEEATDGNVFVQDGLARLIDWGEASVSHPFVGGLLPLRVATERGGGAERLRDIYLEPFTRFAPLPELRTAFGHAYLLGTVVRALGWHAVLSPFEPSVAAELGDPVAAWLEVFHGILDGTTRLGDA